MTHHSSHPTPTAPHSGTIHGKRIPKGIRIRGIQTESPSVSTVVAPPWGYIFLHHLAVEKFKKILDAANSDDDFKPRYFIHRTVSYRRKPSGHGVMREEKPTISGLVFLQGETAQLQAFLKRYFPSHYLVKDCSTGRPASIPDRIMSPFMCALEAEPERVTFLRDPFLKFAKDHVKLRVLTGVFQGQEGYIVRVLRDRQLVMNIGGYAVALNNIHNEDFEIVE